MVMTQQVDSSKTTLNILNVSKTFVGNVVLSNFDLELKEGEIVALIGQNGSGKSTLIKILSGFHDPDPGARVFLGRRDVTADLGQKPENTGMAFVHQDLPLVPSMTIIENLRISEFKTGFGGRILWKKESEIVAGYLARVGLDVPPQTKIDQLSVTERALVAIARSLSEIESGDDLDARLLVLDEPTTYLPKDGVERLFSVMRDLASQGISILFVSHRLDEVIDYCSRAVVLRGGEKVADLALDRKTQRDLVELMLGQTPEEIYPANNSRVGKEFLSVKNLVGAQIAGIDFAVKSGEILGFVGLPGEGYEELPYLLVGAKRASSGALEIDGSLVDARSITPSKAFSKGLVMLPADRKGASGAADITVGSNLSLPTLKQFVTAGVLQKKKERQVVQGELDDAQVVPSNPAAALATLSGGNQQKVLIRKWSFARPKVYVLHEPTQGVDVGAKRQVFGELVRMAEEGAAVLICSVEFEDLVNLCDRVHVVRKGKIYKTLEGSALSVRDLALAVLER